MVLLMTRHAVTSSDEIRRMVPDRERSIKSGQSVFSGQFSENQTTAFSKFLSVKLPPCFTRNIVRLSLNILPDAVRSEIPRRAQ